MMNVVFLSPHFPPQYFRFCLNLKQAGANVLGIGDEPYERLSQDARAALSEYYRVDDMHDYDALLRACGHFTHRYGKFNRHYVNSHEDILSPYGGFIVQVQCVPGVFSSALGDVGYIFRSESRDEILDIWFYPPDGSLRGPDHAHRGTQLVEPAFET